ncbi:MAG: hypothetical protein ABWK53_07135 [Anaerolineales bacterium]
MRLNTRQLFTLLLFIGLWTMTLRPVADPDFWWHLRSGQWMVENRVIPHTDPFSFTKRGETWVAHEWLAEILIYGLYRLGGLPLLVVVFGGIITAAFALVYLRSPGKPYLAGFALLLGALATAPTWGVRPQMFSLLLGSLFLYLLDRFQKTGRLDSLIQLPLITILWVNLHAGFALGIFLIGAYAAVQAAAFVRARFTKDEAAQKAAFRQGGLLSLALTACLLVVPLNPNGGRLYTYPFETLNSPSMQMFIQEWASPDFHLIEWQPLAWLILALIVAGAVGRGRSVNPTHLLLTVGLGYFALRSMRNVSLFALVAVPLLAAQAAALLRSGSEVRARPRPLAWLNLLVLAAALLAGGLRFLAVVQEQATTERTQFPAAAADWIERNQPSGHLYNTYGWGGYLIWRLYPDYPVYIDGRADLYGDQFIFDYLAIYRAEPGWETALDEANVGLVLIETDAPLAIALAASPAWQARYADAQSVIFTKR